MERTVAALVEGGVAIGAHPGFPDLSGFGRREMILTPDEIRTDVMYQIGALKAFCDAAGVSLHHVKPHGAMYNMAARERAIAKAIVDAVAATVPTACIYAQAHTELATAAMDVGVRVVREVFADRAYLGNGLLAPRSMPESVLHDPVEIADRLIAMIRGEPISTLDGGPIVVEVDTICIHSDTSSAVEIAEAVRGSLDAAGIRVEAPE